MSEQDHTPEPWGQERASKSLHARTFQRVIVSPDCEYVIAELMQFGDNDPREANARRIVACVNACKGLSNERLAEMAEEDRYFGRTVVSEAEAREQDAALAAKDARIAELEAALQYSARVTNRVSEDGGGSAGYLDICKLAHDLAEYRNIAPKEEQQ